MSDDQKGMERREFLRKAAITGATAAWAAPLVQTVAATPAFAQTAGTGEPGSCHHSLNGGCMGACQASGQRDLGRGCGSRCNRVCDILCPVQPGAGNDRQCTSTAACNSNKWRACTFVG